jgi:hypothetical protein
MFPHFSSAAAAFLFGLTALSISSAAPFQVAGSPPVIYLSDGQTGVTPDIPAISPEDQGPSPAVIQDAAGQAKPAPVGEQKPEDQNKAAEEEAKQKNELAQAVAGAYQDTMYNNNFAYLFNPEYSDWHLGENYKQLCAPIGVVDLGGQVRMRYHDEHNFRGLGLTGRDDDFLLHRTRAYVNWKFNSRWRLYSEFLYADSINQDFPPRTIEVQNFEPQNLFIEHQIWSCGKDTLKSRFGRQEISLGSQRLISALDWANTRQTFDGVRWILDNQYITANVLYLRPLRRDFDEFDSSNLDKRIYGLFNTHKNFTPLKLDTYWLGYEDSAIDQRIQTIGSRVQGEQEARLWEIEGGFQFGENPDGSAAAAGAVTVGSGYKLADDGWKPVLWAYYDWASGDDSTGNGWNQLFPLVHKYLGYMDLFGRRNINDANLLYTIQPTDKLTVLAWYHYFWLANDNDGPYNGPLTPFNPGGTVGSSDLGHEIDLLATYKLTVRSDILLGYSHFFAGAYYDTSFDAGNVPLFNGDADFYYVQWQQSF